MTVKITSFEAENVKRVKAVSLEPAADGLTVIGGGNGQGKTSILDAISWALGGDRFKPSSPRREGSVTDPYLHVELSNGIVVERKGKDSTLKVLDPEGRKSGQTLLNDLLESLALNLPKFLSKNDKEKAEILLRIIGVGDELASLDAQEQKLYQQRTSIGQYERQKRGAAEEMTLWPNVPDEPISASELIQEQQAILLRNAENQKKRDQVYSLKKQKDELSDRIDRISTEIAAKQNEIKKLEQEKAQTVLTFDKAVTDYVTAQKTAEQLQDENTEAIEKSLADIDATNAKIRENATREAAIKEADELKGQYDELSNQIDTIRNARARLLDGADLPLPELGVESGVLTYKGKAWDCMSSSEQLRVSTAIVRRLKPECGFVLVDKLEQFDTQTLADFGSWAESEGLQVIGTRVSTGDECSIIIEDGRVLETATTATSPAQPAQTTTTQAVQEWSF